jgi:hypothetical protein
MPLDVNSTASGNIQPQTQIAPEQITTADPQKIVEALKAAVQQAVDAKGFVDLNKLIIIWPQIAKAFGINIPFQTVMQLIQQNPDLLEEMIVSMGLAGVIHNGRYKTAQELASMGSGAVEITGG